MTKGFVDNDPKQISDFKNKILSLKDGQIIELKNSKVKSKSDVWNHDITYKKYDLSDADTFGSLGSVKVQSLGNLQAKREGDVIRIDGKVHHSFKDRYDFNDQSFKDRILFSKYKEMADKGSAKPFDVYAEKSQKISGIIFVKNGKITDSEFKWEDVDQ